MPAPFEQVLGFGSGLYPSSLSGRVNDMQQRMAERLITQNQLSMQQAFDLSSQAMSTAQQISATSVKKMFERLYETKHFTYQSYAAPSPKAAAAAKLRVEHRTYREQLRAEIAEWLPKLRA